MNEEQKQNHPAAEGTEGGEKKNRNRRRRHRGGKKHGGSSAPENRTVQTPQPAPEVNNPGNPQGKGNDNRGGRSRRDRRRRRGGQKDTNRGIADLYGTPSEADSLSMEELRAKIVLQAADGSVPANGSASISDALSPSVPSPAKTVAETDAESVEITVSEEELLSPLPAVFSSAEIAPDDRAEIIGVRFRSSGKAYFFDPKGKTVHAGDSVIVDTARGAEFGEVAFGNRIVSKKTLTTPLRPLIRVATPEDIARNAENREREKEAAEIFRQKAAEHKLEMKLIDVQFAFDNAKLIFYFTSEGRVDFRDLVKDLAGIFRTRIELRQIGIRDEAKLLGGLGACGRPLCCASFLSDFVQVSIKMAKEQGLSLNSAKISG